MRLLSFEHDGLMRAGVLVGERVVALEDIAAPASSVRGLLGGLDAEGLAALGERAAAVQGGIPLAELALCAPVPDAQKIICLGLNYRDHAAESGQEIPTAPMWFAKFANSLSGSGRTVVLPSAHPDYVDYEAELAVVIGRTARKVDAASALDHVAGAMPFNDVSARDLQLQNQLWTSGKAIDGFAPCGPALVTLDEVADLHELGLRTRINGELVQEGNTRELIFDVPETIAWLSRTITLVPGDIIATGTPAGVGASKNRFLRDGDTVEVEVDGLGAVVSSIRADG
jgi:2-keto-4-pentenoate hydratase/2-oxohepta-3-ene-1,7-dioic acid hydratase in catechol pathway